MLKSTVQHFGMYIKPNADVVSLQARVLDPSTLTYGQGGGQPIMVRLSADLQMCP